MGYNWAKRDNAGAKKFYQDLRAAASFTEDGTDFEAKTHASFKVPASFNVPVFSRTDENGNKVSCISAGRQLWYQSIKQEMTLKPDTQTFWTTLVASESTDCVEDDSFILDEFETPASRDITKMVPGGKVARQSAFQNFFEDLATTTNSNTLANKVDQFFEENFRTINLNNIFIDSNEQKKAAYDNFVDGNKLNNVKRIPRVSLQQIRISKCTLTLRASPLIFHP